MQFSTIKPVIRANESESNSVPRPERQSIIQQQREHKNNSVIGNYKQTRNQNNLFSNGNSDFIGEISTLQNSPSNNAPSIKDPANRKETESILVLGKVTSSKWLPQVNNDKKKAITTRITIGGGETTTNVASPAMMNGQPNLQNLRATQRIPQPPFLNQEASD